MKEILKEPRNAPLWLLPAGALISFLGALCGIGGGLFVVPLLVYTRRFPLRSAVATSVVHVLITAACATAVELSLGNNALNWPLVIVLGAGTLAGAEIGYRLSKRIDTRWLRLGFALLALLAGSKLLYEAGTAGGSFGGGDGTSELPAWALALALGIGVAGGSLTPLLGVGGGIVFVPALHLSLPDFSYNSVRAASLAVMLLSATRSGWLYAREGAIHTRSSWWLGIGAVLGSLAGVLAVHRPGETWLGISRVALALILLYVAARFGWDALRARVGAGATPP